jgi:lipopolysaccharide/colanic/teichoic acid biosynthesis glycosyltransferase
VEQRLVPESNAVASAAVAIEVSGILQQTPNVTSRPITSPLPQSDKVQENAVSADSDHLDVEKKVESPDEDVYKAAARLRTSRRGYRIAKRAFDIVFSLLVMIVFSWLYGLIALAIKIEDPKSPVLYRQERVSRWNGDDDVKHFKMYKFRSMVPDADKEISQLWDKNEKSGPVFKMKDDPRVTKVGRIIRKMSLDELPQFMNVLKNDMSIVGPRPALSREVVKYTERQKQRLLVKPGITCFWQTQRDRDKISFNKWVDFDLYYIKKCSALTDLRLIGKTVAVVLTGQGN